MKIFLASASPRRRELFGLLNLPFEVAVSGFDESSVPFKGSVREYAIKIAEGKARALALEEPGLIIAADTVVSLGSALFGKPEDTEDARRMLSSLAGKTHQVTTGLCLIRLLPNGSKLTLTDAVQTLVAFRDLSEDEVENYLSTGEPFDKAGGYGIQGYGATLVESIKGCYYNVVGLPVSRLIERLGVLGISPASGSPSRDR